MPKMPKSPPELVARFDADRRRTSRGPTRRLTFGYPCLYVGGNMVSGLFGERLARQARAGRDDTRRSTPRRRGAVRADAGQADDRLHAPAPGRRRRRRRDPRLGRASRRLRHDPAAQGPEGEGDGQGEGRLTTPKRPARSDRTGRRACGAGRSAAGGRPDVLVQAEQVRRVVAALDVGQPLVRRRPGRRRGPGRRPRPRGSSSRRRRRSGRAPRGAPRSRPRWAGSVAGSS